MAYANLDQIAPMTLEARAQATLLTLAPVSYANGYGADLGAQADTGIFLRLVYRVALEANQAVSVELRGYDDTRQTIVVYDETGRPIDAADYDRLSFIASFTGVYFIEGKWASHTPTTELHVWVDTKAPGLQGNDYLQGSHVDAGPGHDSVSGTVGADALYGGEGNDALDGGAGGDYVRGDAGDDQLNGGDGNDDINGNMGADTGWGGVGDDWVVGGKDNDSLSGDGGNDIVYGNLGSDTCDGGSGNDIVRGGQQDDAVRGGIGADWLSGDVGDDTMSGGGGADIFHTFGTAGLDLVRDFNQFEGDRVQLDPGTVYTVAQVNSDVVITMAGGGRMVLVDVTLTGLPFGWLFVG